MHKSRLTIVLMCLVFAVLIFSNKSFAAQKTLDQAELNAQLNRAFDAAFNKGNLKELITFAYYQMPIVITPKTSKVSATLQPGKGNVPDFVELESGKIKL